MRSNRSFMDDLEDFECFIKSRLLLGGVSMSIYGGNSEKMIEMGECIYFRGRRKSTSEVW